MYIPSNKKDVVFTIAAGLLMLTLALTWNSGRQAKLELAITKVKLVNCEDDLKREQERHNRTKAAMESASQGLRNNLNAGEAIALKTIPLLKNNSAIIELIARWAKSGKLSSDMLQEATVVLK